MSKHHSVTAALQEEQQLLPFAGQLLWQWRFWLLCFVVAGGLAAALWQRQQQSFVTAQQTLTIADAQIKRVASMYPALPANSTLMLGALEIDELVRIDAAFNDAEFWRTWRQSPEVCRVLNSCPTDQLLVQEARLWQSRFSADHTRRGNLLVVKLKGQESSQTTALLASILVSAAQQYRARQILQLDQQIEVISTSLSAAAETAAEVAVVTNQTTNDVQVSAASTNVAASHARSQNHLSIGARGVLASKLDSYLAERHLLQQAQVPVFAELSQIQLHSASNKVLRAGMIGALMGLLLGAVWALLWSQNRYLSIRNLSSNPAMSRGTSAEDARLSQGKGPGSSL